VESDENDVIGKQHEAAEFVRNSALSKGVISEITDIHDLRILHNEFVHRHGCDPEENTSANHGDDSWNPAQDTEKIC
jgi:hypothetical protein